MNIKINKDIIFDYTSKKGPLIISEISSNHGGSKKKFLKLIEGSFDNGADLVKIQTYEPQDITLKKISLKSKMDCGKIKFFGIYTKKHALLLNGILMLLKLQIKKKILFSTPFSVRALNF